MISSLSKTMSQCEPAMKEKNTLHTYDTEDQDDAPIWSDDDFANAVHRVGLKPVGKKLKINLLYS